MRHFATASSGASGREAPGEGLLPLPIYPSARPSSSSAPRRAAFAAGARQGSRAVRGPDPAGTGLVRGTAGSAPAVFANRLPRPLQTVSG